MKTVLISILSMSVLGLSGCGAPGTDAQADRPPLRGDIASMADSHLSPELATRFSALALDCVHREYPNKISHVFQTDADAKTPRELYPAFYGCFDWHSSVHGHWLLVRLLHVGPEDAAFRDEAYAKLAQSFTPENIAGEVAYLDQSGRASFERPYGLAWFLQLISELEQWDDPAGKAWRETLRPLEAKIVENIKTWLPNLAYPIRLGTHNQSAFAFGLMLDYARQTGDTELEEMLVQKSLDFHAEDKNCPLSYEPSGEDFLSPCLMEADLMRRVLSPKDFDVWLKAFLPGIPEDGRADWLTPGIVLDASDGKLVHLDGVNLSRAWNLYNLADSVGPDDPRYASLMASAAQHKDLGIASVSDEHYSGSHWLASFATYLVTRR